MEMKLTGVDIGNPGKTGSTAGVPGGFDLLAGGEDIWMEADQFHFAQTVLTGDFSFTARLEALHLTHPYTKAGIMARESLDADAAHVFLLAFPDNRARNRNNGGIESQTRDAKGAACHATYPADFACEPPLFPVRYPDVWLRLARVGDRFDCWFSVDGSNWKLYSSGELALPAELHVGLAVTSHDGAVLTKGCFRDVKLG